MAQISCWSSMMAIFLNTKLFFSAIGWRTHPVQYLQKILVRLRGRWKNMPTEELFIVQAGVPGHWRKISARQQAPSALPSRISPLSLQHAVDKSNPWGNVRIIDSGSFKVSNTVASALVTVKPGGMRELHWHPNADEWQYHISGQARMTVFTSGGRARTMDFHAGDVGYVPKPLPHYVENTGYNGI